jgi:hypothetical protein
MRHGAENSTDELFPCCVLLGSYVLLRVIICVLLILPVIPGVICEYIAYALLLMGTVVRTDGADSTCRYTLPVVLTKAVSLLGYLVSLSAVRNV